jgi:DNA-binding NtrC family response regulator
MGQFRFTQRPTLSEGLNVLQQSRFDLVLLNLALPDASAAESATKILKLAPDLPLIALVDEGDTVKACEALQLGTDDYLFKGCDGDYLTQMMRHAIERKRLLTSRRTARTDKQLTAHLSHEVRNALACIHQFGTILIDGLAGSVSDEQREYLCIMTENASKIRTVLDDALESASKPGIH